MAYRGFHYTAGTVCVTPNGSQESERECGLQVDGTADRRELFAREMNIIFMFSY